MASDEEEEVVMGENEKALYELCQHLTNVLNQDDSDQDMVTLHGVLTDFNVYSAFQMVDTLVSRAVSTTKKRGAPETPPPSNGVMSAIDILDAIDNSSSRDVNISELDDILHDWDFRGLLMAYDDVASKRNFEPPLVLNPNLDEIFEPSTAETLPRPAAINPYAPLPAGSLPRGAQQNHVTNPALAAVAARNDTLGSSNPNMNKTGGESSAPQKELPPSEYPFATGAKSFVMPAVNEPRPLANLGLSRGSDSGTLNKSLPRVNPGLYERAVRMVGVHKSPTEPLGVTVKVDNGELLVARIIADSVIDKQRLLNVGDIIKEVNGREVATPKELQEAVKASAEATIVMKIIPGYHSHGHREKRYLRALFNFDPSKDQLIPCRDAGLIFRDQDVLEVLEQDDKQWWQARVYGTEKTGLIPSQDLMERRRAWVRPEWDYTKSSLGCGMVKRKKKKVMYNATNASEFDKCEFAIYEEVWMMPPFDRKTLVLIGAPHVGRRTLKNQLLHEDPTRFGTTMPHTSRKQRPHEANGRGYWFAGRPEMEDAISRGEYLEWGEFDGDIYGTQKKTVMEVIRDGKMCVLDVNPQALRALKTADFSPFVVFVAAPSVTAMEQMYQFGADSGFTSKYLTTADFDATVKESIHIERTYKQYFDMILVNDNMQACFQLLYDNIENLATDAQWVPVNWVF